MEAPKVELCENPRQNASLLSVLTFWWTKDMFRKGSTRTLGLSDLYTPLEADRSDTLGDGLEKHWKQQLQKDPKRPSKSAKPSLVKAIFRTFWRELMLLSTVTLFGEIILRIAQPILLGRLLLYFRRQTDMTHEEALYYAIGMIAAKAASVILDNQYSVIAFLTGVRSRIAVCSLMYRKALRLSRNALSDTSPGKVVNLMSNDVNRFDILSYLLCYMWSAPIVTIIVLVLLWHEVGWAGPIGMGVIFVVTPIQSVFGKLTSRYRLETALCTDKRIRSMDEIISGIYVIKLYAWEKPFAQLISLARKLELKTVLKSNVIRGLYMTFQLFTTRAALLGTIVTLILMDEEVTAAKVFVVASYLNIVSHVMAGMFIRGVAEIAEGLVATRRLQDFLELEEIEGGHQAEGKIVPDLLQSEKPHDDMVEVPADVAISLRNVTARWESDKDSPVTLNELNIEFRRGQLIGIVGAIGSGKSSILQAILKELPIEMANVLFGIPMDKKCYRDVLRVCALDADLKQFPDGDRTILGDRGISLSGGQKARVCLARAVYKASDVYLLDDPLSAVDAHVARHLFDLCLGARGYLGKQGATRILVTHQVHFLVESDWIVVMNEGKVQAQGTPHDLIHKGIDLLQISEEEYHESQGPDIQRQNSVSSVASSKSGVSQPEEDHTKAVEQAFEKSSEDTVKGSMFMHYVSGAGGIAVFTMLIGMFVGTQLIVSFADYWVSFWVSQEELRTFLSKQNDTNAQKEEFGGPLGTDICLYVQTAAVAGVFIIGLTRATTFYRYCARASQSIHDWCFRSFISATLRFFDTNPAGRMLNRFSKDMGAMDELLPKSIMDSTQTILTIIGAMVVVMVVQPYFIVPILVLLAILLYARSIYMKTSQNTRRLEGITRSPIFSHIATTLHGLSTIRSFQVQSLLISEFEQHQNVNTGANFMFHSGRFAFGMVLDLIFFVFLAIVVFTFLLMQTDALGDKVGLVVTQITALAGSIQFGIRQSAEMFNHLIAVERLLEYRGLPSEKQPAQDSTTLAKVKQWPSSGGIQFKGVNFKYFEEAPLVLRNLCFEIKPKEKIGIVGRTGAGKSSIIGSLFRTALIEGSITIDEVDTAELTLETLRSSISIIPQDPVLFSGTLRKNLDPFDRYSDEVLWRSLELVELKDIAGPLGLQSHVAAGGSNFSVGQRQLLCLARAILRENKILVLDEATANVDPETDRLIQQTIREQFVDCTVLTIAHRLNTIMDYDRVLVMSDGTAIEFGTPRELLEIPNGVFKDIVLATGPVEAENLMNMARKV
ncbi:multidrug resistance-associated protein 1 [Culex quinquefasciatus]|uniref:Multidrug resistance-associated protein 1 n=1 Tax=Culex quinquefasciatus TaxID=7176 RepID=B0WWS0_CULQU|nr:multidrug resistance-associated protein 1 [Culex quinquefasciatus]|eukprot:XP_001861842.1 multidrug resistance-associated protein 1 [Culex quinquefasciatus]